ncbi:MarR family winged helix-turn-helix transcriptional regulator [Nonomuraea spiralis]|uniref:MarR family winged helix-turn-helix transcriptional regulator n=1 Tax=Nonomuraea spiralis TaxID=46182 RepID=A0ABV5ISN0_9ACTN|nr:MarR family transcriptional regulator [Nonomuraea spiralis]GGT35192.1 MarR family transcriptional regulator [Nonomuraea spiralis]
MLDETLTYALIKVVKAHRNRMAAALVPLGLHVGQELLLNQLWRQDGLTQGELISRLGVEPPTVTKTLQRLERSGLVYRSPDPERPRVARVHLTEAGKALREPVEEIWTRTDEQLQRGLNDTERDLLTRLVRAMPR